MGAAELSGKRFRQVVRRLCSVLEFLRGKGIIYRDIKPSNCLIQFLGPAIYPDSAGRFEGGSAAAVPFQ